MAKHVDKKESGMIITFMGNDGSGKTTTARSITNFFKDLGFKTTYRHEYEYSVLKIIFKFMGNKTLEKARKELLVERKRSPKYLIWPIFVWLDTIMLYSYFKLFKRREIIILDRYAYDQYLSYMHLGNLTRFTRWLYLHFPKPDIAIVLAVAAEKAYERKKDTHTYPLVFYEKQTEQYLDLAAKLNLPVIRTDDPFPETLKRIIALYFNDKRLGHNFRQKGIQNRIIFSALKKYNLPDEIYMPELLRAYEERKKKFLQSMIFLREIMQNSGIELYGLIKTLDEQDFIGNDIDVLIASDAFEKIYNEVSKKREQYNITKIVYNNKSDKGKMDIFVEGGLKLDIHSYVGWRNVSFFGFDQLSRFFVQSKVFGVECNAVDKEVNSLLVIMTHAFEKGFVTFDEYLYLQKNFSISILASFESFSALAKDYIKWLEEILQTPPQSYPVFIPIRILFMGYRRMVLQKSNNRSWRVKAMCRDLALMMFWRARYRINGRLPFEIPLD